MRNPTAIKVLLVDDHRFMLWGLAKLLESAQPQMEVIGVTTSPREALEAARAQRPDVVLLDLDLDGRSGVDLIPELARHAAVLIFTGLRDIAVQQRAVLAGARGVLLKSEPGSVILKAIEHVYAGSRWLDRVLMDRLLYGLSCASPDVSKSNLTTAERKVVAAVVQNKGLPNKVIAANLKISEHTLRNHLSAIYGKVGVNRRIDLVFHAMEHGIAG